MGAMVSAPVEAVRIQKQSGPVASVGVAEMQGWRDGHEDSHFLSQPEGFAGWTAFGVLDGHGGSRAARLAAKRLPVHMILATRDRAALDGPSPRKLQEAFVECDKELYDVMDHGTDCSGTTVVTGGARLQPNGKFTGYIANAGDSRGILVKFSPSSSSTSSTSTPAAENKGKTDKTADVEEGGDEVPKKKWMLPLHRQDIKPFMVEVDLNASLSTGSDDQRRFSSGSQDDADEDGASPPMTVAKVASKTMADVLEADEQEGAKMEENKNASSGSPAILYVQALASIDHKPDRKDERERIKAAKGWVNGGMPDDSSDEEDDDDDDEEDAVAKLMKKAKPQTPLFGGDVARLDGNLAVSRGLGDFQYKMNPDLPPEEQKVSCVPEIFQMHDMERGDLIILACDGIFDVLSNEVLVSKIVRHLKAAEENLKDDPISRREDILSDICESIIRECLNLESRDNMTLMIIQLGGPECMTSPSLLTTVSDSTSATSSCIVPNSFFPVTPADARSANSGFSEKKKAFFDKIINAKGEDEEKHAKQMKQKILDVLPTFEQTITLPRNELTLQRNLEDDRVKKSYHVFLDYCRDKPAYPWKSGSPELSPGSTSPGGDEGSSPGSGSSPSRAGPSGTQKKTTVTSTSAPSSSSTSANPSNTQDETDEIGASSGPSAKEAKLDGGNKSNNKRKEDQVEGGAGAAGAAEDDVDVHHAEDHEAEEDAEDFFEIPASIQEALAYDPRYRIMDSTSTVLDGPPGGGPGFITLGGGPGGGMGGPGGPGGLAFSSIFGGDDPEDALERIQRRLEERKTEIEERMQRSNNNQHDSGASTGTGGTSGEDDHEDSEDAAL